MSYERAWVVGLFGNVLVKRHGSVPDRPARDRIRVARAFECKAITLQMYTALNAVSAFLQRRVVAFWSPPRLREFGCDF